MIQSPIAIESNGEYIELPMPKYGGYSGIWEELVRADRNTLGNLIKQRINKKYTVKVEWRGLTSEQKNQIMSLTSGNSFGARILDTTADQHVYISASAGGMYRAASPVVEGFGLFDGTRFQWYNVSMELIER